jgi:hypothetical protein
VVTLPFRPHNSRNPSFQPLIRLISPERAISGLNNEYFLFHSLFFVQNALYPIQHRISAPHTLGPIAKETDMSTNLEATTPKLELHEAPLIGKIITGVVLLGVGIPVIGYVIQAMTTYTAI